MIRHGGPISGRKRGTLPPSLDPFLPTINGSRHFCRQPPTSQPSSHPSILSSVSLSFHLPNCHSLSPSHVLSCSLSPQHTAIGQSSSSHLSTSPCAIQHDLEEARTCCLSSSATKTPTFGWSTARGKAEKARRQSAISDEFWQPLLVP